MGRQALHPDLPPGAASRDAAAPGGRRSRSQRGAAQVTSCALFYQESHKVMQLYEDNIATLLQNLLSWAFRLQRRSEEDCENNFGDAFVEEGSTNVKFPRELTVPGYSEPLIILGTGYREKFFVKVYAAAFYVDYSIGVDTEQWREKVGIETFNASSVFDSIFKAPVVKSLSIILVRDVDGKTFMKALADIIARRIKQPTAEEESALSTFRNTFLGRNLKKGTSIYLSWLESSRMLISTTTDQGPCQVDSEIKSATVNYAIYDGFFGTSPVSPTLKSSAAQLLEAIFTK